MDIDASYIQGMEDFYNIIKAIYELTYEERMRTFGMSHVSMIIDKFDFQQIREKMAHPLKRYFVIRGISVDDNGFKHARVESGRLQFRPDEAMIKAFMDIHKGISFCTIEEIYVGADK